jgi:N-acetylmuramoyl-L-alanine amidase
MTDLEIQAALVDESALALTMWGEGRGDWREGHSSLEERVAIGAVVRNRLPHFKAFRATLPTYRAVCLAPNQFSCWMKAGGAVNYAAVMAMAERVVTEPSVIDPLFSECLFLARGIISGVLLDQTGAATMYYAPAAMLPPGTVPTSAAGRPVVQIGAQVFYA